MDKEATQVLAQAKALNRYEQGVLLRGLNAAINQQARQAWQVEDPDMTRLAARYGELRSELAKDFAGALTGTPRPGAARRFNPCATPGCRACC